MSGRQLAAAMNVSPSWINYRLTGRQPIDLNDLYRIARALDIPVLQLFPYNLREAVRHTYPLGAGGKALINRGERSPVRGRPPSFGQRSDGRKIDSRPPGHPTSPLRRAA